MISRIKWRFTITYLAITFTAMTALGIVLSYSVEREFVQEVENTLQAHGKLVKNMIESTMKRGGTAGDLTMLCRSLGAQIRARVTVYGADGSVLGDSHVTTHGVGLEEGGLPESAKVLRESFGCRICHSEARTLKGATVIIPLQLKGQEVGKIRLWAPLYEAERAAGRTRRIILATLALTSIIMAAISMRLTASIAEPITLMNEMARKMAAGDLSQRVPVSGKDEVAELAASLNLMAERLSDNIGQLAEQKDRMGTILRTMADGIVVTDRKGEILLLNPASERMFGVKAQDVVGKEIEALTNIPNVPAMVRTTLETGRIISEELGSQLPAERIVQVYSSPVHDERGSISGAVLVLHDVTESRRLVEMRKDFVANVSHELRTPVASIRAIVGALQAGAMQDPQTLERFVNSLDSETERLSLLLTDLLNISELESGKRRPRRSMVNLREIVGQAVSNLAESANRSRIGIAVTVPPALRAYVDRRQIYQVVVNLVDNAIKYTPEGGSVEISGEETESSVILRVKDTGVGIAPAHIDRIFERFYRVDKARSRQLGGTGLGLSIVRDIVEAHGGTVTVESTEGVGSTFTVTLPKMKPESEK